MRLTDTGEKVALETIRHHRLIELYLVEALGYGWDEVHEEAEELEHYISEKFEARIAAFLGNPLFDPHGDPIPTVEGTLPDSASVRLIDVPVGTDACIVRVCNQHNDQLRYIASMGLVPGTRVVVTDVAPFKGPITLQVDDAMQVIDSRLAQTIFVKRG